MYIPEKFQVLNFCIKVLKMDENKRNHSFLTLFLLKSSRESILKRKVCLFEGESSEEFPKIRFYRNILAFVGLLLSYEK